jgi:adenylate cyclase
LKWGSDMSQFIALLRSGVIPAVLLLPILSGCIVDVDLDGEPKEYVSDSFSIVEDANDVTVINAYGFVLSNSGEKDDSLSWLQEAKRLDPLSPAVWLEDLAECHYMLGNYQCAIDLYLSWRNPPLHTYTHLAACYVQLGRMTEAQEAVANFEREKPADTDFPRYAAAHCRLCLRQEDADHWMEGYRKAGLVE